MPDVIRLKIKRQDTSDSKPYWEEFEIPYRPQHNIISVLMALRENPLNVKGQRVAPVAYEVGCMEEVCGACTMIINGKVRQACSALVDQLSQPIVLEPMSKFPVVRDLLVDRQAMFDALRKVRGWIDIDGGFDVHVHAPRISPKEWVMNYDFSRCMTCGCCMEVCPQYNAKSQFIGPAPIGQAWLFNNHPTGKYYKGDRLHSLMGPGGITDCGNAQNCIEACPKEIKLTDAIAKVSRDTTVQMLKDLLLK
jgi:succinate dehydrogenase / fumarate reductase iron-sulfur subunit